MYKSYFGLREAPFAISPNPRYLYMSALHREALAHLLYGIRSDGCMILLTGEVGTGKTTLCRCLLEQLPEDTEVAVILNPRLSARELLRTVCEELSLLQGNSTGSIKTYVDALNAHLLQAHAADRTVAIIIDEAQNLAVDVLEQLRLLTNLETPTRKLLRILLLGQPELRDMLERPELSQVNQRITSRYHLTPLQSVDADKYIRHRLSVAGDNSGTIFTKKAIRHAISLTGGIPRLINILCDRALLGAYAINADQVDLKIMKRAGEEIFPKKYKKARRRAKTIAYAAASVVLLAIPLLVLAPDWLAPEQGSTPAVQTGPQDHPTETAPQLQPPEQQEPAAQDPSAHSPQQPPEQQLATGITDNAPEPPIGDNPPATMEQPAPASAGEQQETIPAEQITVVDPQSASPPPPDGESRFRESVNDDREMDKTSSAPQPTIPATEADSTTITIRVSTPLLVPRKAGPTPVKAAQELLAR